MFSQTMKLLLGASLLSIAAVDAKLYFTHPLNPTWIAGMRYDITWKNNKVSPPMPSSFTLKLLTGPDKDLQVFDIIADVDSAKGSYEWTIPDQVGSGTYVISGCNGTGSDIQCEYSHSFTIVNKDGNAFAKSASTTESSKKSETSSHLESSKTESHAHSSETSAKPSKTESHDHSSETSVKPSKTESHSEHSESKTASQTSVAKSSKDISASATVSKSASASATPVHKDKSDHNSGSNTVLSMIFVGVLALGSSLCLA